MTAHRAVQLRWDIRSVAVHDLGNDPVIMTYPGIRITRHESGHVVSEVWLPVGERSTYTDDEALIAALHSAWRWTRTTRQ
ncbi:hypothetical protein DMC64_36400 [Amycolatopsis sp. WAC 04197]|uniref:hypothetical protein n=1 Tax=Amycolatopsis sp. WAC 04197 TaxID=2203199 RepID=UPI000F7B765D|nr:hypothetical protein [Amycolatopsis sp. WAC 04197]RSN39818.1 hypothetical protein DMC64_36400 [Amycolatopsis sp. WAC 04197]